MTPARSRPFRSRPRRDQATRPYKGKWPPLPGTTLGVLTAATGAPIVLISLAGSKPCRAALPKR